MFELAGQRVQFNWILCGVVLWLTAHASPASVVLPLDADHGVVLPSKFGEGLWRLHHMPNAWVADDWNVTADVLNRVDGALSHELSRAGMERGLPVIPHYYRQYIPGLWKGRPVVLVNGFGLTNAELFPNRGIPTDDWKHQPTIVFGGGCWFWYGIYLADTNSFMTLKGYDSRRHIVCNARK